MTRPIMYRASILSVLLCFVIGYAQPTQGWKPSTHVYLALKVLEEIYSDTDALGNPKTAGTVPVYRVLYKMPGGIDPFNPAMQDRVVERIGEYSLHPDLEEALREHTSIFIAGTVGPDAYPDLVTGQQRIHVHIEREAYEDVPSDAWLAYLWRSVLDENPGTGASEDARDAYLQKLAFVSGYLVHAAGDMYMHTFINLFAGGPFSVTGTTNGFRHLVAEGYVGKRTPSLDDQLIVLKDMGLNVPADPYRPDMTPVVFDFIYRHLVDAVPGTVLGDEILVDINPLVDEDFDPSKQTSFPRFMSTLKHGLISDTTWYAETLADFDDQIASTQDPIMLSELIGLRLAHVTINEPRIAYARNWIDDIEEGLRAWPAFNHKVMQGLTLSRDGMDRQELTDAVTEYRNDHLLSMLGAPDLAGDILGFIEYYQQLLFPQEYRDAISEWQNDFIDAYLLSAFDLSLDEIEEIFTNPELRFDPVVNTPDPLDSDGIPPLLTTIATFNQEYLYINDSGYQSPALRFDPYFFEPAYNTMTITKLLLMDPASVTDLQQEIMCEGTENCEMVDENAMLSYLNSMDTANEFRLEGGIYDDTGEMPPRGAMPFVGCGAYRQLFYEQPGEINTCNGQLVTPFIAPSDGLYNEPTDVILSHPDPDADLFYAIVDSDQASADLSTVALRLYEGPITLPAPLEGGVRPWIVVAQARREGFDASERVTASITIDAQLTVPSFFPETENHTEFVNVTLSGPEGSSIFYTINGEDPTFYDIAYTFPIRLPIGKHTIRATAYRIGFTQSQVVAKTYEVFSSNSDRVVDPVFKYASFSGFAGSVEVDASTTTQDADIRITYMQDGVPEIPTESSELFTKPFDLGIGNWFIRAIAFSDALPPSNLVQVNYNVNEPLGITEAPVFSPPAGTYTNDIEVTIEANTDPVTQGVRIFFSVDGSEPPTSPVLAGNYSDPVSIARTTTLKAQATRSFFPFSDITEARYTFVASQPVIEPDPGTYSEPVLVAMASATNGSEIRYTLDGTEPNEKSTLYTEPFKLAGTATVKARAYKVGYETSTQAEAVYEIEIPAAPVFVIQPVSVEVFENATARFVASATGIPVPSLQWLKDGELLEDIEGDTLLFLQAGLDAAGTYQAIAVNEAGDVLSESAELVVYPEPVAPMIMREPDDAAVKEDSTAIFLVEASGSPAPGYQWLRNGSILPSQTGPSLVFENTTLEYAGEYVVIASNIAGADTSRSVMLSVVVNTSLESFGDIPFESSLESNYPNPFSGQTKIPFAVAEGGEVRIELYDVLGRQLAILMDRQLPAGRYEVDFNADGLASGVYLYRMKAGTFERTRQLTIVR